MRKHKKSYDIKQKQTIYDRQDQEDNNTIQQQIQEFNQSNSQDQHQNEQSNSINPPQQFIYQEQNENSQEQNKNSYQLNIHECKCQNDLEFLIQSRLSNQSKIYMQDQIQMQNECQQLNQCKSIHSFQNNEQSQEHLHFNFIQHIGGIYCYSQQQFQSDLDKNDQKQLKLSQDQQGIANQQVVLLMPQEEDSNPIQVGYQIQSQSQQMEEGSANRDFVLE